MKPQQTFSESPAYLLESVFRDIQEQRMQDLPVVNRALHVESVGFRLWNGNWLGVLVTPWFMSVLLLPGDEGSWPDLDTGGSTRLKMPHGELLFMASEEERIGPYLACSLASPVHNFADQATIVETAREALRMLMMPAVAVEGGEKGGVRMSRRAFLRGSRGERGAG